MSFTWIHIVKIHGCPRVSPILVPVVSLPPSKVEIMLVVVFAQRKPSMIMQSCLTKNTSPILLTPLNFTKCPKFLGVSCQPAIFKPVRQKSMNEDHQARKNCVHDYAGIVEKCEKSFQPRHLRLLSFEVGHIR